MEAGAFFLVGCGQCGGLFALCEAHYAGQSLCGDACRRASQRAARRKHQRSPEGYADHLGHVRAHLLRCTPDVTSRCS